MKRICILGILLFNTFCGKGQKKALGIYECNDWPSVSRGTISGDGNYASYIIENQPRASHTLVIKGTNNAWKRDIVGGQGLQFTADSRMAICINGNDSLYISCLGTAEIEIIPNIVSYSLYESAGFRWLIYKTRENGILLKCRDLITGGEKQFSDVNQYWLGGKGNLFFIAVSHESNEKKSLNSLNIETGDQAVILNGVDFSNIIVDSCNNQLVFAVHQRLEQELFDSFCYYRIGDPHVTLLADSKNVLEGGLYTSWIDRFSRDGKAIFFLLKHNKRMPVWSEADGVDVWSYNDDKLQSQQLLERDGERTFSARFDLQRKKMVLLEHDDEGLVSNWADNVGLVAYRKGKIGDGEVNWNSAIEGEEYLVSYVDGSRKKVKDLRAGRIYGSFLSPGGKYVLYFDADSQNYFSFQVDGEITRNVTHHILTTWTRVNNGRPDNAYDAIGIAGWTCGDSSVLLYDQYDIWKVSLDEKAPPENLTNRFGVRNHIVFKIVDNKPGVFVSFGDKLMLSAFDLENKNNGFYYKKIGSGGDPRLLTMGPYVYDYPDNDPNIEGEDPKADNESRGYLVRRMTADESPNYFFTSDFSNFTPLSFVHPEKNCNWIRSELINWKGLDGCKLQGILYKPENFDPARKYPVIIYYYETLSDRLHMYLEPELSGGSLNIPWYVSNGYLVFTPDIHYEVGEIGESVVNSVVSGANELANKPWVDSSRMGIQGLSLGGYETIYLVAHTHLFAAACAASGLSDLVSAYGSLAGTGASLEGMHELTYLRMGATIWQRPDLYIKNSPIFTIDKVTTPLLIMATRKDGACPFTQDVELFTGMRRLKKKVWMLQYDDGNHVIGGKSATDFTIRMAQFFDHYLKGSPAPIWMTEGIPAFMKGNEDGLGLDLSGKQP